MMALPIALFGLFIAWLSGRPYTSSLPQTFSSEVWKAAEGDTRCRMIADLQYRVGVEGKSRAAIHELLGPPENEEEDPRLSHWHLCPSFMDIYILEVRWHDGMVADAWVRDT